MKGDFTRSTFDPKKHYSSVRMQQGRVQLDADWNEQMDITTHRVETEAVDLIGGCGGPIRHAGFHVVRAVAELSTDEQARPENQDPAPLAGDGDFYLSGGRYYVDGILCENDHIVPYSAQPDLPFEAADLEALETGTYLAYLDVWQRHITALEDESIREVALGGPDTTTRTKTVWQVRLHRLEPDEAAVADCLSAIPSWEAAIAPGTGRLAAQAEAPEESPDPCIVAPGAGYRRLENQLYRVEVHEGGGRSDATFKWSRDNGAIVVRLESQNGAHDEWTVSSLGRDEVLRFASGQWVELTDDAHALRGEPGTLIQVVRTENRVITLDPATATGSIDAADFDNPRVRRWDGLLTNVTNANWRLLEGGVQVRLFAGTYRTGDYWQIPARTADADVEWPIDPATNQPARERPHGVAHHYCRLALMTFDADAEVVWTDITDCRNLFPPVTELTSLFYVGGDGQETMPAAPVLPQPLEVGVANGQWPVAGAVVRFEVTEGNGQVNDAATVEVVTDADGIASCVWTVDATTQSQEVQSTLLDAAAAPTHLPIRFHASLSVAREVAYTPAEDCDLLADVVTVQDALDVLCRRGWEEPGIHVLDVVRGDGERLRNDTDVPVAALAEGFRVLCDDAILPETVRDKPVCYVTLQIPYPLNFNDQELWGSPVIGTQPLRLDARLDAADNTIVWQPTETVRAWLLQRLFPVMTELERGSRVLAYLTLKGNYIWNDRSEDEALYLDGDVFGRLRREDGGTDVILPSGDRRRGGDLEMWFWLVEGRRPIINVNRDTLDFEVVPIGSSRTLSLVIENRGTATLAIRRMTTNQSVFTVLADVPFDVPPDSERSAPVRFTPTADGVVSGELRIESNDPQRPEVVIGLTGRGRGVQQEVGAVQFINNIPDLEAIDVFVNGEPVLDAFVFQQATPYGPVQTGRVQIDVFATGTGPDGAPLARTTVQIEPGEAYVVILHERLTATAGPVFEVLVRTGARRTSTSDEAAFFIAHGAPDVPSLDVLLLGPNNEPIAALADNLSLGGMTEYRTLAPAVHTLLARTRGQTINTFRFDLSAREAQTFVLLSSGRLRQEAFTLIGFDAEGRPIRPGRTPGRPVRDVSEVPGIGPVRLERLRAADITTADEVATMTPERLAEVLEISPNRAATLIANAQDLLAGAG